MSSGSSSSSFALIAFSSFLTLLISHLAVRQGTQIIQQPVSPPVRLLPEVPLPLPPPPSPPPPPPPPPSPPPPPPPAPTSLPTQPQLLSSSLVISSNGVSALYLLVILVLLFGLGGLWLDVQHSKSKRSRSHRNINKWPKKKGYVSTTDSSDESDNDVPGSWKPRQLQTKDDEFDRPKSWKGKMKEKVQEWEESVMKKTSSVRAKGKQKADGDNGQDDGIEQIVSKAKNKEECCGCCRILLERFDENEKRHREQQKNSKNSNSEEAERRQKDGQCSNDFSSTQIKSTTETTTIVHPTTSTNISPASDKKETNPPTARNAGSTLPLQTASQSAAAAKDKGKAKEAANNDTELIAEPPIPMPEYPGAKVEPLGEDVFLAAASSTSKSGKEKDKKTGKVEPLNSSGQVKDTDREDPNIKGKNKDKNAEESKDTEEEKSGNVGNKMKSGEVQGGASSQGDFEDEKGESKLKRGLHVISNITKDISEEVLKQVLAHLDGREVDGRDRGKGGVKEGATGSAKDSTSGAKGKGKEVVEQRGTNKEATTDSNREEQTAKDSSKSEEKNADKKGAEAKEEKEQGMSSKLEGQKTVEEGVIKGRGSSNSTAQDSPQSDKQQGTPIVIVDPGKDSPSSNSALAKEKKGKGKEKEDIVLPTSKSPAGQEADLASSLKALLASLQAESTEKKMYRDTAEYLAAKYPTIVAESSGKIKRSLDKDFLTASEAQKINVKLPWYSDKTEADDNEPHQDGKEVLSTKEAKKKGNPTSGSKALQDREAIARALDLYKIYQQECAKDARVKVKKDETVPNVDGVLQTMIASLLQSKKDEDEKGEKIKKWSNRVANELADESKDKFDDDDSQSRSVASGYPDVIPLEAINASSLAKVGVLNNKQNEKKGGRLNETFKSVTTDAQKNINFIKDDLVDLREGATSKAKTLKSLLKKPWTDESKAREKGEVKKASPRKSVRLQDAAGHGEGPRDEARGETEQAARYRRLREMASRLND